MAMTFATAMPELLVLLLTDVVVDDGGADVVERMNPAQAVAMVESFMMTVVIFVCLWCFGVVVL